MNTYVHLLCWQFLTTLGNQIHLIHSFVKLLATCGNVLRGKLLHLHSICSLERCSDGGSPLSFERNFLVRSTPGGRGGKLRPPHPPTHHHPTHTKKKTLQYRSARMAFRLGSRVETRNPRKARTKRSRALLEYSIRQ